VDLWPGTLTTRSQRRSHSAYIYLYCYYKVIPYFSSIPTRFAVKAQSETSLLRALTRVSLARPYKKWLAYLTHATWQDRLGATVTTYCDNLNRGMALWKQNSLTRALVAVTAFEILSLWSYALHETMVALPETFLKLVSCDTSEWRHVASDIRKVRQSLSFKGIF
jgi:hypothetical protein